MNAYNVDITAFWVWLLLFARMTGLFQSLPGIGTQQISVPIRSSVAMLFAFIITISGVRTPLPDNGFIGGLMLISEFMIGYVLGEIPSLILSGVAVGGQLTTGTIGLGQANMIDPSLGVSVSVLSRIQTLLTVVIFLIIDGHHMIIRLATGGVGKLHLGAFHPDMGTALILTQYFADGFQLAITLSAPVIVTLLVTQFILGILTRFVPQMNIMIVSLPLTIGLGLYIVDFTIPGLLIHVVEEFHKMEEHAGTFLLP